MINPKRQRLIYVVTDYLATNLAWLSFNVIRYELLASANYSFSSLGSYLGSATVVLGQILFPLLMLAIYWLSGYYNNVYLKSRIDELVTTASTALIGALVIFFVVLVNDMSDDRKLDYALFGILFGLLMVMVYIPRVILTSASTRRIHSGRQGFKTLIVGTGANACEFASRTDVMRQMGFIVCGYVHANPADPIAPAARRGAVIEMADLAEQVRALGIQRLIVLPSRSDRAAMLELVNSLFALELPIYVRPNPDELLFSRTNTRNIVGDPLIDISRSDMPQSTINIKRMSDIVVASLGLVAVAPLLLVLAAMIKADSRGPVFYRQQRIGFHKRPFNIIKLRTMYTDAEHAGPALSHGDDDPRITPLGRTLRKYRLDELPQLLNVVRGEMSLVGPRPEREYYIRRIMERAPYYALLHQVRPGITSWGMVRYGYATTVDQMVERLNYDLLYLENISFPVDMKIILYTFNTVIKGKGK